MRKYHEVVTLCGSTKFKKEFEEVAKKLSLEGKIVLTLNVYGHSGDDKEVYKEGRKEMLDEMHLQRIDMSDAIFVINKDQYIGESTKKEIQYAIDNNKSIYYLEGLPSKGNHLDIEEKIMSNPMYNKVFNEIKSICKDRIPETEYKNILSYIGYIQEDISMKYSTNDINIKFFSLDKLISTNIDYDSYDSIIDIVHYYTQYIIFELKLKDYIKSKLYENNNTTENRYKALIEIKERIVAYKHKMPFATLIEELQYLVKIAITDILYKKDLQKRVEKNL